MRTVVWGASLILLGMLLFGCSGDTKHTVVTGEEGSLLGLDLLPEPQSFEVDLNDDFALDWEQGFRPPSKFTVALREVNADGTTDAILTDLETISTGHYRLNPTSTLPTRTFLLLTVSATGEKTVRAMYLTEDNGLAQTRSAPDTTTGKAEHTVTIP